MEFRKITEDSYQLIVRNGNGERIKAYLSRKEVDQLYSVIVTGLKEVRGRRFGNIEQSILDDKYINAHE